jgi:hypothetical protein
MNVMLVVMHLRFAEREDRTMVTVLLGAIDVKTLLHGRYDTITRGKVSIIIHIIEVVIVQVVFMID